LRRLGCAAASVALVLLASSTSAMEPCASTGLNLRYEAFIAGVNAGEASLQVSRKGAAYRVAGTARSKGLWESMQQWRAEYSVDGMLEAEAPASAATVPAPGHFYSLQTTPRKRREIHIEDGILKETKNHKVRDPRPAQTGYDLLSALFFLPACHARARIHTGRDGYEFSRIDSAETDAVCDYAVIDEQGGDYRLKLTYQQLGGFTVPQVISVRGPLPGRMVLAESTHAVRPAACDAVRQPN